MARYRIVKGVIEMTNVKLKLSVASLVALAITAGHLIVPDPAAAAGGAMFRVLRAWYGDIDATTTTPNGEFGETYSDPFYMAYSEPRPSTFTGMDTQGGFWNHAGYPPATAVFTPMGGFELPRQVIHFGTQSPYDAYTADCANPPDGGASYCGPGYPQSIYYYSYYNYKGFFQPNHPNAPPGTGQVTVRRSTSYPATGPNRFQTTQFADNYAFGRVGSIKVDPGPNKFGGTMRFFWGLNARWYFFVILNDPCCEKGYGHNYRTGTGPYGSPTGMLDSSEYSLQTIGQTHARAEVDRTHTYLTTGNGTPNAPGALITRMSQYINTSVPWTTGRVEIYQAGGVYLLDRGLRTGYDNRNASGTLGSMSLVAASLSHSYLTSFNPVEPILSLFHGASIRELKVTFMPEPVGILLLGAGILGLAGVYRLRRR